FKKLWKGGYCMSKLSPKPSTKIKKLTWQDLDILLKSIFEVSADETPSATIELELYEMSKSEIISEATAQGYEVIDNNNGYLVFN
ncbi:TPA: hypothetical protein ACQNCA_001751, partial [Streptococcus pyogenes]